MGRFARFEEHDRSNSVHIMAAALNVNHYSKLALDLYKFLQPRPRYGGPSSWCRLSSFHQTNELVYRSRVFFGK